MNRKFVFSVSLLIGIVVFSLPLQAQSFGNLFRRAAQHATQQVVRKTVEKAAENKQDKQKQSSRDKQLEKQMDAMIHPGASKEVQEDEAPTVRLPKQHTALLPHSVTPLRSISAHYLSSNLFFLPRRPLHKWIGWTNNRLFLIWIIKVWWMSI